MIDHILAMSHCSVNMYILAGFSMKVRKTSRNGQIIMSFTYIGYKSCLSCEFLKSQICLLTLSSKIKSSRKFVIYII